MRTRTCWRKSWRAATRRFRAPRKSSCSGRSSIRSSRPGSQTATRRYIRSGRGDHVRQTTWWLVAAAAGSSAATNPAQPKQKKGQLALPLDGSNGLHLPGSHAAWHLHRAGHPKLGLVRVEKDQNAAGDDRDREGDDVETTDRDLQEDLVNDLQDRV